MFTQDVSLLQASTQGAYEPSAGSQRLNERVRTMLTRLEGKLAHMHEGKKLFKELDLNKDGVISTSELMNAIAKYVCGCVGVCVWVFAFMITFLSLRAHTFFPLPTYTHTHTHTHTYTLAE